MLAKITDKQAWSVALAGLAVSLVGAALAPQEEKLGDWLKLVVWHGMLKWAIIVTIFTMGALALARLLARKEAAEKWAQAMQVVTLPFWVFAVLVGALSAKLVWGGWNLTELRAVAHDKEIASLMGIFTLAGSFAGSAIAAHLPGSTLRIVLGAIGLIIVARMLTVKITDAERPTRDNPWLWIALALPVGIVTGVVAKRGDPMKD